MLPNKTEKPLNTLTSGTRTKNRTDHIKAVIQIQKEEGLLGVLQVSTEGAMTLRGDWANWSPGDMKNSIFLSHG